MMQKKKIIKPIEEHEEVSIILPKIHNIDKLVKYNRERLLYKAKDYVKNKKCPKCRGKSKWRIVPLFEYGDPYMPSSVQVYCKCGHHEEFARAPDDQARAYAESLKKQGFKRVPDSMADKLIKL